MLAFLFESKSRRAADEAELDRLRAKYGDTLEQVLRRRVDAMRGDPRGQKHWKRLLNKVR
jgi:hypothetical protein